MVTSLLVLVVSVLLVLTLYPMVLWFVRYSPHGVGDIEAKTNVDTYRVALSHMSIIATLVALVGVFAVWRRGAELKYRTILLVLFGVLAVATLALYLLAWYMSTKTAQELVDAKWLGFASSILQVVISLSAVFGAVLTAYGLWNMMGGGAKKTRGKPDSYNYGDPTE
jgi:uncharacterized Tic20 family protein